MEIYPDFKKLFECFNAKKVEYVIVGTYALIHHGGIPTMMDVGLYVRPSVENSERIVAALVMFGFRPKDLHAEDFQREDQIGQIGRPPDRVNILTSISGVTWEQVDAGKAMGEYGGEPVPFIGRDEFIASKKAAGRPRDLVDIENLARAEDV